MKQSDLDAFIFDLKASADFFVDDLTRKFKDFAVRHGLQEYEDSTDELKEQLRNNIYYELALDEMKAEFSKRYVNE